MKLELNSRRVMSLRPRYIERLSAKLPSPMSNKSGPIWKTRRICWSGIF